MNPKVVKGTKIILVKGGSQSGMYGLNYEGKRYEVNTVSASSINVRCLEAPYTGQNFTMYPTDEYILEDRKSQANYLIEKNEILLKEVEQNKIEIKRLSDFETEEDYVAHKLHKLMTCKGEKQMAEILKTLKETHYL